MTTIAQAITKRFFPDGLDREVASAGAGGEYRRYICVGPELSLDRVLESSHRVSVGALYAKPMKSGSQVGEKELVFDMDTTDCPRNCECRGKKTMCNTCWRFMQCAVEVMTFALETCFALKGIVWVFSGRRGVHCWVFDERVSKFSSRGRAAILAFICGEQLRGTKKIQDVCLHYYKLLHPGMEGTLDHVMDCMMPKVDKDVTLTPNHLTGLPLTTHGGTGKILLPFDHAAIRELTLEDFPKACDISKESLERAIHILLSA